jgi:hypothetical protein
MSLSRFDCFGTYSKVGSHDKECRMQSDFEKVSAEAWHERQALRRVVQVVN